MAVKIGVLVEICPSRAGGKTQRDYGMYDGCRGLVVELIGAGEKARVNVESKNLNFAGGIAVPVQALRPVEA